MATTPARMPPYTPAEHGDTERPAAEPGISPASSDDLAPKSARGPASGGTPPTLSSPQVTRLDGARTGPRVTPPKSPGLPQTKPGLSPPLPPPVPPPTASAGRTMQGSSPKPFTQRCTSCGELYPSDFLVCPRDATPLSAVEGATEDPLLGSLIGETYQIVRVVGEGGMGRVYEARHLRLKERRFAVKCLHADLARNPEMAARFLREAETSSSIKHENVVDVFDVHHLPDGTPYLVGEFLEGEELADYVAKRGPMDPRGAAKVARQVCHALAAAHQRGVVHRDMKPENIFVLANSIAAVEGGSSRSLQVKVLDFGISKAGASDTSNLTRTGVIMGTPSYMAPEQARGRPVDHRADIYAVGACLYFMVTGRRPFDSDDPTSTLSMVLTEDPVRPREVDQRIPEALELIIQRAMSKDAADRYSSMDELDKALAAFTGTTGFGIQSVHGMSGAPSASIEIRSAPPASAFDVAKAVLGSGSLPPPTQQSNAQAKMARPMIVLTSIALSVWLIGGTVAALAGLVRVLHENEITLTECLLLVAGCLFAAGTPIGLYVFHVRKSVWPNSVRSLQLATDLKRLAGAAFVTYGAIAIVGRVLYTVFLRNSHALASGRWDMALFGVSFIVAVTIGAFAPLVRNLRRRRRE